MAALAGCAVLSPPPPGPLPPPGEIAYGLTFGIAGGAAEADIVDASGLPHRLGGNGDMVAGGTLELGGVLASPRLSLHFAPTPVLDLGGHVGGWDAGLGGRLFLGGDIPVALAAGAQVGYTMIRDRPSAGVPFELRVGLEAYPFMRGFGPSVLGVGIGFGPRRHGLPLPDALAPPEEDRPAFGRPDLDILRPELRVDLTLGTVLERGARPVGVVALSPYLVLQAGRPRSACACAGGPVRIDRFHQIGGIAVTFGPMTHIGISAAR